MDTKSRIVLAVFLVSLGISVGTLYWRYVDQENYPVLTEDTPLEDPIWVHFDLSSFAPSTWLP